jgi:LPXTG-site transpeptidase (sortase) family protein
MGRRCLRFVLRWLERALFIGAVACATWIYVTWKDATFYQLYAKNEMDRVAAGELPPDAWRPSIVQSVNPRDSLIGVLSIPSVEMSVAVVEGDDDQALRIAAGHLPDTPLPWEKGNSALAGHRDSFFAPLARVSGGDEISLTTRHGILRYRVVFMTIVGPDDLSVLGTSDDAALTLITCYPFGYLGSAPQRFIVQAVRLAPSAAEP